VISFYSISSLKGSSLDAFLASKNPKTILLFFISLTTTLEKNKILPYFIKEVQQKRKPKAIQKREKMRGKKERKKKL
jgi:hypothetical protein